MKNKLTVVAPSWHGIDLLKVFVPNAINSFKEDTRLIVVINEYTPEDKTLAYEFKDQYKDRITFVLREDNIGPMSVDYANHLIDSELHVNINNDMLLPYGWDEIVIKNAKNNKNITQSLFLVEPYGTGNPLVIVDNLGDYTDPMTEILFHSNFGKGKYKLQNNIVGYNHPIVTNFKDYLAVGGYSNNFDMRWTSGYSLDNYFPWRLKQLKSDYRFVTLKDLCVYHGISLTNCRQNAEYRAKDGIQHFIDSTGYHWINFNREINAFSPIEIDQERTK